MITKHDPEIEPPPLEGEEEGEEGRDQNAKDTEGGRAHVKGAGPPLTPPPTPPTLPPTLTPTPHAISLAGEGAGQEKGVKAGLAGAEGGGGQLS